MKRTTVNTVNQGDIVELIGDKWPEPISGYIRGGNSVRGRVGACVMGQVQIVNIGVYEQEQNHDRPKYHLTTTPQCAQKYVHECLNLCTFHDSEPSKPKSLFDEVGSICISVEIEGTSVDTYVKNAWEYDIAKQMFYAMSQGSYWVQILGVRKENDVPVTLYQNTQCSELPDFCELKLPKKLTLEQQVGEMLESCNITDTHVFIGSDGRRYEAYELIEAIKDLEA